MDEIIGVAFSLPKDAIEFMFSNNRDVFVKYISHVPIKKTSVKIKKGMKLYLYQSGGTKQIVGEAVIEKIDFLNMSAILENYSERLVISEKMFQQYSKGREDKRALIFELSNLKKYNIGVNLSKPINMGGLYITTENKSMILR